MNEKYLKTIDDHQDIIVTHRAYNEVCRRLFLNAASIPEGSRVLSVGEGLSDFAQTLQAERRVVAYKLDTVYGLIHPEDTREVAEAKIDAVRGEQMGRSTRVNWEIALEEANTLPVGAPAIAVAASAYDIPKEIGRFTHIFANRSLEHMDMGKALAGMLEVLAPHGEIRIGSPFAVAEDDDGCLRAVLAGFLVEEKAYRLYRGQSQFKRLLRENARLRVYAVIEREIREDSPRAIYQGWTLIIRNDDTPPDVEHAQASAFFSGQQTFLHRAVVISDGDLRLFREDWEY